MLPTKPVGEKKIMGVGVPRAMSCPKCSIALERAYQKEDEKLMKYFLWPFIFFFVALISNQKWLLFVAVGIMLGGVLYVARYITRPSYKNRSFYKVSE